MNWFLHLKRMDEDTFSKRFYQYTPKGKRRRDKPYKRWKD
jgi:hypothetical protein